MRSLRKILIIHPEGNIFNNPTLKCLTDLLIEHGIEINLRYCNRPVSLPITENIKQYPYGKFHYTIKKFVFERLSLRCLINLYVRVISRKYSNGLDCVIGVDREGIIEASSLANNINIPCIFFSFEIFFEVETGKRFKQIERTSVRKVKHWFIQDEIRKNCLMKENDLSGENCTTLPVASAGIGFFNKNRLRDDLEGIGVEKKVAILIGSITDWTMAKEILESVKIWPDNWVLIVHNRYGNTLNSLSKLEVDLSILSDKRIFISNYSSNMVDDMGYILNGVSVGLTFYKPNFKTPFSGRNLQYLGLSSGKINTCLRYGVPVIMNNIGLYSMLAVEKKFGVVVTAPLEIGKALKILNLNEAEYKKGAIDFFKDTLDFNNYRDLVWDRLSCVESKFSGNNLS